MALMLRKACQEALNKADLDPFHADISSETKNLVLYTPCGKTFAFVHGVTFGKMQPTLAEIDYAVELLTDWLDKNEKNIEDYLEAKEKFEKMTQPRNDYDDMTVNTHAEWGLNPVNGKREYVQKVKSLSFRSKGVNYTIDRKGDLICVDWKDSLPSPWWQALKPAPASLRSARSLMDRHVQYQHAQNVVSALASELNSCSD